MCHSCFVLHLTAVQLVLFLAPVHYADPSQHTAWICRTQHLILCHSKKSIYGAAAQSTSYLFHCVSPILPNKQESWSSLHSFQPYVSYLNQLCGLFHPWKDLVQPLSLVRGMLMTYVSRMLPSTLICTATCYVYTSLTCHWTVAIHGRNKHGKNLALF